MIKKLLVVFAGAAVISLACFTVLGVLGGFPPNFNGPWPNGDWANGGWWGGPDRYAGPQTTRDLPFTGAPRIDIGYPAEITYTQGAQARFTVTGPKRILDQLQLDGGDLTGPNGRDGPRFGWGPRFRGRLRIDIVSPDTHEFDLAGAQKLSLRNYDQDSLILHIAGAADVEGVGRAKRLEAHIAGAGHLDLEELSADDADIAISGAGDASVDARSSAEVAISGAGHVQLRCRPPVVIPHISGFGSVDDGPSCSELQPPASSAPPASASPAQPAPKSDV